MASSYKYFADHDRVVATNDLTEVVSNTSGAAWASSSYAPKYFTQYGSASVDFATSTRVFDITFGRSSDTANPEYVNSNFSVEQNIYNQFAKVLLGHDSSNNIVKFNLDPDDTTGANVLHNAYFVNFSRSQFKDMIRQGSFSMEMNVSGTNKIKLVDSGSAGTEARDCVTGYYGKLYATASSTSDTSSLSFAGGQSVQGLVFYEAGVAVVSPYIFSQNSTNANPSGSNNYLHSNSLGILVNTAPTVSGTLDIRKQIVSGTIDQNNYAFATHLLTASYQATTELNSTIYFCRAYNHEFNYSSNPTYLQNSEIVVKGGDPEAQPRAYITTVGLYSDDNQLLAVAKLSEPVLKTPENELIARVRLDF